MSVIGSIKVREEGKKKKKHTRGGLSVSEKAIHMCDKSIECDGMLLAKLI